MNDENSVFDDIEKYQQQGRLVFFVGAGVSRLSGYPSWSELVQRIADEIKYDYKKNSKDEAEFSSDELLKIPQMFYDVYEERKYKQTVRSLFDSKKSINTVHDRIFSFSPCHILTTNYDNLLEEAAVKNGKIYSIINSDDQIHAVKNQNYIIKVHGDFSSNKDFVLKEDDYLNYENNYKLIDNLVKSIFSTNLVIFIGYSLADYNIKLIFNWVKKVQGTNFINPIFIHVGNKTTKNEYKYFKNKKLRVIYCNEYYNGMDDTEKYKLMYINILDKIKNHKKELVFNKKVKRLKYIYNKINYVNRLAYLRKYDLNIIFNKEFYINDKRQVEKNFFDFETFLANEKQYKGKVLKYCLKIKSFLMKNEIIINQNKAQYNISKTILYADPKDLDEFCKKNITKLEDEITKAYYYVVLGQYEESYDLYTDLLYKMAEKREWVLYYICQLNRKYLSFIINNIKQSCDGIKSYGYYGRPVNIIDEKTVTKINTEMEYMDISKLFEQLPYYIKINCSFLENISPQKYYLNEYRKNFSNNYKTKQDILKQDDMKALMLDSVKFIYENKILFWLSAEYKNYVRYIMIDWLFAYDNYICKEIEYPLDISYKYLYKITFQDIVLITKTFSSEDMNVLDHISLSRFDFEETILLEKYVSDQVKYYTENFGSSIVKTIPNNRVFFWHLYSFEIMNLLSIAAYFVKNMDIIYEVIKLVIDIPGRIIYIEQRHNLIYKWLKDKENKYEYANIFEEYLLNSIKNIDCCDTRNKNKIIEIFNTIGKFVGSILPKEKIIFTFHNLSIFVLKSNSKEDILNGLRAIEHLLDDKVKQFLKDNPPNIDLDIILEKHRKNETIEDDESINIIIEALESEFAKQVTPPHSLWKYSVEKSIIALVGIILSNNLSSKIDIKKYFEKNQNFDFLMSSDKFDKSKFDIKNFCLYTDLLLKHLKENSYQKEFIISAIDNTDLEALNKEEINRLFYVYKFMKN